MKSIRNLSILLERSASFYHIRLDADGKYLSINSLYRTIFFSGVPDLPNEYFQSTVFPDDADLFAHNLSESVAFPGKSVTADLRKTRKDGSIFWIRWEFCAFLEDGQIAEIVGIGTDTSERKRAEVERQEARDRLIKERQLLRMLIDNIPDSIYVKDIESRYLLANHTLLTLLDVQSEDDAIGKTLYDFYDESVASVEHEKDQKVLKEGFSLINEENRLIDKKGKAHWLLSTKIPLKDENRVIGMVGIVRDITVRKELQDRLAAASIAQQRNITEATIMGQEKERAEIGRELHDNINQVLTTTKLYLDMALNEKDISEELTRKSHQNVSHVIEEIRVLSKSLVPPSLGDIGLKEAISEMIKNLRLAGKIDIRLKTTGVNKTVLPNNIQLMIFRVVQEQINNIIKHSNATKAEVNLAMSDNAVHVTVSDNGIGFDPGKKSKGIGLMNIISRAKVHNGEVNIISAPGKGCNIKISIPI